VGPDLPPVVPDGGRVWGQQQTLQGGLKVGDPTSLSSANLPITTGYHWNVGFAISWKIK